MVGLEPHSVLRLDHGHGGRAPKELGKQALVRGVEMLHEHERHPRVGGEVANQASERLEAAGDAQIELRRVVPISRGDPVKTSTLCGDQPPALVALLHRRDRVDLMLFRAPARLGPDAPVASLCGAWRLKAR